MTHLKLCRPIVAVTLFCLVLVSCASNETRVASSSAAESGLRLFEQSKRTLPSVQDPSLCKYVKKAERDIHRNWLKRVDGDLSTPDQVWHDEENPAQSAIYYAKKQLLTVCDKAHSFQVDLSPVFRKLGGFDVHLEHSHLLALSPEKSLMLLNVPHKTEGSRLRNFFWMISINAKTIESIGEFSVSQAEFSVLDRKVYVKANVACPRTDEDKLFSYPALFKTDGHSISLIPFRQIHAINPSWINTISYEGVNEELQNLVVSAFDGWDRQTLLKRIDKRSADNIRALATDPVCDLKKVVTAIAESSPN